MGDNNNLTRVGIRMPINLSNPLWNNLVAGWKFDGNFNDVLNVANGTSINGAGFTTGKVNQGYNGVKNTTLASAKYVNFGNSISNRNLQFPLTISSWIKQSYSTTSGGSMPLFLDGVAAESPGGSSTSTTYKSGIWLLISNLNTLGGSARVRAGFGNGTATSGAGVKEWRSDFVIPKDTWMHVVVVFTNTNTVQFYVNGTAIGTPYFTGTATNVVWKGNDAIAGYSNNHGVIGPVDATFEGAIDETYVWNRVITQTEITELYNLSNGKQYPN